MKTLLAVAALTLVACAPTKSSLISEPTPGEDPEVFHREAPTGALQGGPPAEPTPVVQPPPSKPIVGEDPLLFQREPPKGPLQGSGWSTTGSGTCCVRCGSTSKACGDSCIGLRDTCHHSGGCAC